jgi:hypothetical protein
VKALVFSPILTLVVVVVDTTTVGIVIADDLGVLE